MFDQWYIVHLTPFDIYDSSTCLTNKHMSLLQCYEVMFWLFRMKYSCNTIIAQMTWMEPYKRFMASICCLMAPLLYLGAIINASFWGSLKELAQVVGSCVHQYVLIKCNSKSCQSTCTYKAWLQLFKKLMFGFKIEWWIQIWWRWIQYVATLVYWQNDMFE